MRQPWITIGAPSPEATSGRRPWATARGSARVGIGLHSINDVEEETATLHNDMMQFGQELHDQLFLQNDVARPGVPEAKIDLYRKIWRPLMNEWLEFHDVHSHSFWQNLPFSGAWDRIQDFRQRFLRVRDSAKAAQFQILTPEPLAPRRDLDLPKTVEGAVKVAAYAAVAIGGLFALKLLASARKDA